MRWTWRGKGGFAGPTQLTLAPHELPGGPWALLDERMMRLGTTKPPIPEAVRARDAGHQASWRSYEWPAAGVSAWLQVVPLVSEGDADALLARYGELAFVANSGFAGQVDGPPTEVVAPDVPGARGVVATEQAVHVKGVAMRNLSLRLATGCHVVLGTLSGPSATVHWSWWADAGTAQVERLTTRENR